ncbi:MAG: hypothetical protein HYT98_02355 [Candidatus Sungbacteria bacterium]|nr:hypothetical protein [Candidatus Sungbacteria bacterium]
MEVRYSQHLEIRLTMRGIPHELPRIVYENAKRRFHDTDSDLDIAVLRTAFYGRQRDVVVAYRIYSDYVLLITIHPLKEGQFENRIRSGRWTEIPSL